jgi:hypothetical protein
MSNADVNAIVQVFVKRCIFISLRSDTAVYKNQFLTRHQITCAHVILELINTDKSTESFFFPYSNTWHSF